jgi:hypothetical protein
VQLHTTEAQVMRQNSLGVATILQMIGQLIKLPQEVLAKELQMEEMSNLIK